MNLLRLRSVIRKEFRQMRRDPVLIRLLIIAPIFQLIMFGYAATTDVQDVPVVVADQSNSRESREVTSAIRASGYFDLVGHVRDYRDLKDEFDAGHAQLALHIPPDFARDLRRGESASLMLYIDGTDAVTANTAASYMVRMLGEFGEEIVVQRMKRRGTVAQASGLRSPPQVEMVPRVWYNPDLRSANYMVPGVFGLIIMVITTSWTAQSIVREREIGTLEQLLVTPVQPLELLIGKSTPYGGAALIAATEIMLLAVYWFGVPLRGSVPLLFGLAMVFIVTNLGLGLLISTISRTQQQAILATFFVLMPAVLLSGFMFPVENMPWIIQQASLLIPYRYFLEICRGIFLRGVGLEVLWPQAVALTVFGMALFTAGALSFRKRL
ncbi:MAG: ABC transporter permease subunit [Armatimonadia bacterium]|nr:ABC transporter permease subunit [Armatimonadia bacterium]